jgi:hypothetical protein
MGMWAQGYRLEAKVGGVEGVCRRDEGVESVNVEFKERVHCLRPKNERKAGGCGVIAGESENLAKYK